MKITDIAEGYSIQEPIDRERYTDIPGLEGPFKMRNGAVVYYDPKEGKYYNRDTDMYISDEDFFAMDQDDFGRSGVDEAINPFSKTGKYLSKKKFDKEASKQGTGDDATRYARAKRRLKRKEDNAMLAKAYPGRGFDELKIEATQDVDEGSPGENKLSREVAGNLRLNKIYHIVVGKSLVKGRYKGRGNSHLLAFRLLEPAGTSFKKGEIIELHPSRVHTYDELKTEANQGGKTEHSGAKKGKGAYYGRKADAKQDSKKNRRANDKKAVEEEFGQEGEKLGDIKVFPSKMEGYGTVWEVKKLQSPSGKYAKPGDKPVWIRITREPFSSQEEAQAFAQKFAQKDKEGKDYASNFPKEGRESPKFKKGDKIEWRDGSKRMSGVIISVDPDRDGHVEYEVDTGAGSVGKLQNYSYVQQVDVIRKVDEANQVKTKEKKPKKVKPSKGGSSPHPYRGRLVGEAVDLKTLPQQLGSWAQSRGFRIDKTRLYPLDITQIEFIGYNAHGEQKHGAFIPQENRIYFFSNVTDFNEAKRKQGQSARDLVSNEFKKRSGYSLDDASQWYKDKKAEIEKNKAEFDKEFPTEDVFGSGSSTREKKKALQKILMDPHTPKDKDTLTAIRKRLAQLQAELGEGKDKPEAVKFNPVAKNMNTFNKAATMRDRKKDAKRGKVKHKNNPDY